MGFSVVQLAGKVSEMFYIRKLFSLPSSTINYMLAIESAVKLLEFFYTSSTTQELSEDTFLSGIQVS